MIATALANPAAEAARSKLALEQSVLALRMGDVAEAQRVLRERLLAAPGDADALAKLAEIERDQGRLDEAVVLLGRAVHAAPGAAQLRLMLADLFQARGELQRALDQLLAIGEPMRSSLDVQIREAALAGQLGRREEEIACYRRLLASRPDHAALWTNLGNALNYAGRSAEAVEALRKAVALRPSLGEAWWSLANLKSHRFDDRDIAAMRKALRGKLGEADRLHFHFALGKAFEDRDDFDRSFRHYSDGNALRAATIQPQLRVVTPIVDQAIAVSTPELFAACADAGDPATDPIFVVGLQRSGSTLVEQILASHPLIEGTSELMAMPQLWEGIVREALAAGRTPFEHLASLPAERLRRLGADYLERARPFRSTDRPMFVDKQPGNWMHVTLIRLALPNAKIVDARRHPMACGFSNFKQHYATGVAFAYSQETIGRFYADYLRLMTHLDQVQPGAIHRVINERLIDDPEGEVRSLIDYVGLPFDPACLEFHKTRRTVQTPSAEQVRRPINRDGVDYWRRFERFLDPMKQALGDALDTWDRPAA